MTLHSAKGLEFPVVFVSGVEETLFPLGEAALDPEQLEEERRLFYVGLTRAEERVYLTHASERRRFADWTPMAPSRFLKEIPEELVEVSEDSSSRGDITWKQASTPYGGSARGRESAPPPRKDTIRSRPAARQPERPKTDEFAQDMPDYDDFSQDVLDFLEVGRYVMHPKFGRGKIMAHDGYGEDMKVVIRFQDGRRRKLLVRLANLEASI